MDGEIPETWLEQFNQRMGEEGIPHIQRPFLAIGEWTRIKRCSMRHDSDAARHVFEWFRLRSPEGAHCLGSVYVGCFYYDAHFWSVRVPLAYGNVQLNALDGLDGMPGPIKERFLADRTAAFDYLNVWVDCFDYGYGAEDLRNGPTLQGFQFGAELFGSGDSQLRGAVQLLREQRPNPQALETARMATEMFLKCYLAVHAGLTPERARDLGHNLRALADDCYKANHVSDFDALGRSVGFFPPIGDRYKGRRYDGNSLWMGYAVAQLAGTTLIRTLTDRDNRDQLPRQSDRA